MSDLFPDHISGQPYELTREQFCQFAGLPNVEGPELWAAVASLEARRLFNPLRQLCDSELTMNTETGGAMRWWYCSTSGTVLEIIEHRELLTQWAPGFPGEQCSDQLPKSSYRVTIPEERDQVDRYHYRQLRSGGSYCK
jgi:hypothetical protein